MDAAITKQRLSVLLSYDWLKMLGVIGAAIAAILVLFTMVATQPTIAQKYEIYSYGGLVPDVDNNRLEQEMQGRFSYDILEISVQNFSADAMGGSAFTARRGVLEGSALFVADYTESGDGYTPLEEVCRMGLINRGNASESVGLFYDIDAFCSDCEAYLARFFGADWAVSPAADEAEIRACFLARNGSDKRFKTDAQKETGVSLERARLEALRENYLVVKSAIDDGTLPRAYFSSDGYDTAHGHVDRTYCVGLNLANLTGVTKLLYYVDADGRKTAEDLDLLFFNNGESVADLKYESFAFVRYLLEKYAPSHP